MVKVFKLLSPLRDSGIGEVIVWVSEPYLMKRPVAGQTEATLQGDTRHRFVSGGPSKGKCHGCWEGRMQFILLWQVRAKGNEAKPKQFDFDLFFFERACKLAD